MKEKPLIPKCMFGFCFIPLGNWFHCCFLSLSLKHHKSWSFAPSLSRAPILSGYEESSKILWTSLHFLCEISSIPHNRCSLCCHHSDCLPSECLVMSYSLSLKGSCGSSSTPSQERNQTKSLQNLQPFV